MATSPESKCGESPHRSSWELLPGPPVRYCRRPGLGRRFAAAAHAEGRLAGDFLVNGRPLSFGDDPTREMWVAGQLVNPNDSNGRPRSQIRVWVEFGHDRSNPIRYDARMNTGRSSIQAVALSPSEPAEVKPATDGTTYVVVGTAGTPCYA